MKYYTYGQTATKIAKDEQNRLIYSVVPTWQYSSDSIENVLVTFANTINSMPGKDRLHIEVKVKKTDDGDMVICAEYVPNDENAKLARVVFD